MSEKNKKKIKELDAISSIIQKSKKIVNESDKENELELDQSETRKPNIRIDNQTVKNEFDYQWQYAETELKKIKKVSRKSVTHFIAMKKYNEIMRIAEMEESDFSKTIDYLTDLGLNQYYLLKNKNKI